MSNYIDLEIIHTLPFSNANRDDAGLPKTVTIGGTTRGRLSSQSLKRAARFYNFDSQAFLNSSNENGYYRTRNILNLIAQRIRELGGTDEQVAQVKGIYPTPASKNQLGKLSTKEKTEKSQNEALLTTLVVVTNEEITALAKAVMDGEEITEKVINRIFTTSGKKDLALWGRFFASGADITMDGAAQVAHALTTHAINIENDFFVGLDDSNDLYASGSGASQPGDAFYLSGTFYKYANICVDELVRNLLNISLENKPEFHALSLEETKTLAHEVVRNFIESFALTVPQGKIRSTAHTTLPSLVRVAVRNNRPVSGATAFDAPISLYTTDIPKSSALRLAAEHETLQMFVKSPIYSGYLSTNLKEEDSVSAFGEKKTSLDDLISSISESIDSVVESLYNSFTEK